MKLILGLFLILKTNKQKKHTSGFLFFHESSGFNKENQVDELDVLNVKNNKKNIIGFTTVAVVGESCFSHRNK